MINKIRLMIYHKLLGTRTSPGLINPTRMTFISLKKFITNFVQKYVKFQDKVLDFGCGNMVYEYLFLTKGNIEYLGIDIGNSPEFNNKYQVYRGGTTPYKDASFDVVFSTQVFEHLDNPEFYAKEIERITKKGGYILLTIAHLWEYHPYPKHYYNIMYDAIPLIFKECNIIEVKGDTTNVQNIFQLFMLNSIRVKIGGIFVGITNLFFLILNAIGISKIKPQIYSKNSMTGNIMMVLKKK